MNLISLPFWLERALVIVYSIGCVSMCGIFLHLIQDERKKHLSKAVILKFRNLAMIPLLILGWPLLILYASIEMYRGNLTYNKRKETMKQSEKMKLEKIKPKLYRKDKSCPNCNSHYLQAICYGYPGDEMSASYIRGEIMLGGCCISGNDPQWHCTECQTRF